MSNTYGANTEPDMYTELPGYRKAWILALHKHVLYELESLSKAFVISKEIFSYS